jgi:AcrR family transcriptional regulator
VAAEAGMSPASVLYYYPDFFQLIVQAVDVAARSLASERAAVAASIPQPDRRLVALVEVDLPEVLPGLVRALGEVPLLIDEHPELFPVMESALADQVRLYTAAIEDGMDSGAFSDSAEAPVLARALVAQLQGSWVLRCGGLLSAVEARTGLLRTLELTLDCALPLGVPVDRPVAHPSTALSVSSSSGWPDRPSAVR